MSLAALKSAVCSDNLANVISKHVLERVPFIFANDWDAYRSWRLRLSHALGVDQCDIMITGTAAVGHSLSPYKSLKPFDKDSDIDVAVVSDTYFTLAWRTLRELRPFRLHDAREKQALADHEKKYVYWGCVATDRLLRVMPFAKKWILARTAMAAIAPTEGREINFRIYRDFRSLRSYQESGLKILRRQLLENDDDAKIS